jgi:MFS superfamily sulfate permease-like transporter
VKRLQDDRAATFLLGLLMLVIGFALWWVPAAFIIPGAILVALGVLARPREVTE